jgi:hypothetical protein
MKSNRYTIILSGSFSMLNLFLLISRPLIVAASILYFRLVPWSNSYITMDAPNSLSVHRSLCFKHNLYWDRNNKFEAFYRIPFQAYFTSNVPWDDMQKMSSLVLPWSYSLLRHHSLHCSSTIPFVTIVWISLLLHHGTVATIRITPARKII